jgi:hypothetical protein
MKTKPNIPTRSKSACYNGHAGNDTNTLYEVVIHYRQLGIRYIEAKTPAEAREKAQLIRIIEPGFWRDWPETYDVEQVAAIARDEIPKDAKILKIPDEHLQTK